MATPPAAHVIAAAGLVAIDYHESVSSTMDVAHALAVSGAPSGTAVLASEQTQGRGRGGHTWQAEPDAGLWLTLIERPTDARALDVLSLRIGLALAEALTPLVEGAVQLKWPNDLYVGARKLAGILIEARWRDGRPEWAAIGVGINRRIPEHFQQAAHVRLDVSRDELLIVAVRAMRLAAAGTGPLSARECAAWDARDLARGRRVVAPVAGEVTGVSPTGAVRIRDDAGVEHAVHSGSLQFL
ncbi:MAG TPA: biotin--[acetyl-CoA-carboxylase] ligase [Gemmatimonas aurantiaca]|uniref:Biotin--[acetyl-CoA-carboxylase] ligase n=2 Tax=Gemmatimonas aurantiaca TaxID=173480 RepID=C1A8L6_GEMAT|nr:biotin--[acetyl-CoA-carboxylase] ligase [Gemmatimonas aurantiaca]BAH38576.1 biotin--[acetyl-CoA-carboxylase] ligase [Gemmatimonas aurantiaca T-27]HCT57301.1 biotin--[acetyl-CoA-carboxylase] ligase [Gemmatimonas aurantiaca]